MRNSFTESFAKLAAATILTGILAGLAGMLLGTLLQHASFGYHYGQSFLDGVRETSPLRRLTVLSACGGIASLGWGLLFRFGRPLVTVKQAVRTNASLPAAETAAHDFLQILTVAMGSPLGREVAPRELGALFAERVSKLLRLSLEESRTIVACGAGAGLAAVYNVPFAGALFALETLLESLSLRAVVIATSTSAIAVLVAWLGLGDDPAYTIPKMAVSTQLVIWAVLIGPLFGIAGYWFGRTVATVERTPKNWKRLVWCLAMYPIVGALAMPFPELLGNGKSIAQLEFAGEIDMRLAAILFVLRVALTLGCLRAGAAGGILTPSIACGALLATVTSGLWSLAWPGGAPGSFAIVGAAAFLAAVTRAPLVAIALVLEFTQASSEFAIPLALAVAGSTSVSARFESSRKNRQLRSGEANAESSPAGKI